MGASGWLYRGLAACPCPQAAVQRTPVQEHQARLASPVCLHKWENGSVVALDSNPPLVSLLVDPQASKSTLYARLSQQRKLVYS